MSQSSRTDKVKPPLSVCMWGTFDLGKPRVRILERGLRENDVRVYRCHKEIWAGVEDKSQIKGWGQKLRRIFRWLCAYPGLILEYLRQPKCDLALVSYLGQLDVLFLWPFAKLKKQPIVWDAFLSLYNTVVEDRKLLSPNNPIAKLIWSWEWLACRAADLVVLDTSAHADYFIRTFHLPPSKVASIFVGAEPESFPLAGGKHGVASKPLVLFYGQFIPLHGLGTIIEAARMLEREDIEWLIIGSGQEEGSVRAALQDHPLPNLQWVPWVRYEELVDSISKADVCLGIFGGGEKASMVIPNKVFQVVMSGKPLITRDSPAVRELISPDEAGVLLVEPSNPSALAAAIKQSLQNPIVGTLYAPVRERIMPAALGARLIEDIGRKGLV